MKKPQNVKKSTTCEKVNIKTGKDSDVIVKNIETRIEFSRKSSSSPAFAEKSGVFDERSHNAEYCDNAKSEYCLRGGNSNFPNFGTRPEEVELRKLKKKLEEELRTCIQR